MFKSLKSRIIAPMAGTLAVVLVGIVIYVGMSTASLAYDFEGSHMSASVQSVRAYLAAHEQQTRIAAIALGSDSELHRLMRGGTRLEVWQHLVSQKGRMGVNEIIVADAAGVTVARSHLRDSYGDDVSGVPSIAAGLRGEVLNLYTPTPTARMVMTTASPILDNGVLVGAVVVNFVVGSSEFLDGVRDIFGVDATVFTADGTSVASTLILPDGSGDRAVGTSARQDIIDAVLVRGEHLTINLDVFGVLPYLAYYFPLPGADGNPNGMFFIGVSRERAVAAINMQIIIMIIIGVAALAAGILLAIYTSGRITRPLVASASALSEISGSLEAAVRQVNDSSRVIAESSNEQAASVEQTSATLNETSSMIAGNAENTRLAEQLALEAQQLAERGMQEMQQMSQTMQEINASSGTLGKIVKSIDDIAFQTNLLAINATVEAARAGGDAGRSFGVVAEEVRNLAQKSAGEASTTTDIIDKDIMLTNAGRETSRQVSASLEGIAVKVNQLSKLVSEVSAASEEQADGVGHVSMAMSQIEQSTQSNAAISQQSAASAAMLSELVADLERVNADISSVLYGKQGGGE